MIKELIFSTAVFITGAAVAQTEIYNEDFQSGLPLDYSIVDNDGLTPNSAVSDFSDAWVLLADPDNAADTIMGSTSYFEPSGEADRWLISPAITLGAFGNNLFWEARSHDPSYPDDYFVMVSRTDTQLSSFTDTVSSILNELETWQQRSANLSEYGLDNETIYIAFINTTLDGFKLYIDDIRVEKDDPAGIAENSPIKLSVSPNPTSDIINVSSEEKFDNYKVISLTGVVVIESDDARINVSNLETGNYFVIAESEKRTSRVKFVKL